MYTDPFAEIQGRKEPEVPPGNVMNLLLPAASVAGAFPVEGGFSPKSWHSSPRQAHADEQEADLLDPQTDQVDVASTDQATYGSEEGPVQYEVGLEEPTVFLEETVPQLPATRIDLPHHELGSPSSNFASLQTPRTGLRVEISSIDAPMNETSPEISILGHPVGPRHTFPSEGRTSIVNALAEFSDTLSSLAKQERKSCDEENVLAIRRVISQCGALEIVKEDPKNRALFCRTLEALSFSEGPLREASLEAVSLLVECLQITEEEDCGTAEAALGALYNLSFSSPEDDIPEDVVLQTMVCYPDNVQVQSNACGLLVNLASADAEIFTKTFDISGCVDALVAAVERHSSNNIVVEHACQLLAVMAARIDGRERLKNKQEIEKIVLIASKSGDASVRRWAGWLHSLAG